MSITSDIRAVRSILSRMDAKEGRPARFGYTEQAFTDNDIEGAESYDVNQEQNVPVEDDVEYNATIISKGIQAQGASIPREAFNHFIGRFSYNVRKLNEQTGAFIDIFLKYASENAGLYDANMEYPINAVCYTITVADGVPVYTWYRRTGGAQEVISNIAPTNENYWTRMSDATMLAQPIKQNTNINVLFAEGVYYTANDTVGLTLTGLPPAVAAMVAPVFVLTVHGTGPTRVQTLTVGTQGEAGKEYTRVMNSQGIITQDWYLSKSPDGLQISAVPEGVFAFRIEDITDIDPETGTTVVTDKGHLFLYYNSPQGMAEADRPEISVVTDPTDPLYGHLVWEYGDDA